VAAKSGGDSAFLFDASAENRFLHSFTMNKTLLALAFASLAATPVINAAEVAPASAPAPAAAPAPEPKPAPLTAEQKTQALETFGWFVGRNLESFGLEAAELDIVFKGIRASAEGKELTEAQKNFISKNQASLEQFLKDKEEANRPKIEAKSKALFEEWVKKNKDYLAKIDKEPRVQNTASGLRYEILAPGTGPKPIATSTVKALYTGKLVDGTVFDSTANRGNEPASFRLDGVIAGWTEGLQKIAKGGKILLYVPPEIGYGAQGNQAIPGGAVLTFEVELVDFTNEPAPAPKPAAQ
jgi:FKBP-type peptidyl-prolyl cis-trans isomerase